MKCQLCGSEKPIEILDLGDQPICNAVLIAEQLNQPEPVYPLKVYVCPDCFLMQLDPDVVSKEQVFGKNYNYLSGSSSELVKYFGELANRIIRQFSLTSEDLIIDVGSNDGTFLSFFKDQKIRVLGIEPTPLSAKKSKEKGIMTCVDFFEYFNKSSSHKINLDYDFQDKPKIITAMNVIAHTNDIHGFLENVKDLLTEDGVFISQSHYLPALVEKLEYDTIYHEHLRYYTLTTLQKLFEIHGLYIFNAEIVDIYGGSIIVYASLNPNETPITNPLEKKYQKLETYIEFANNVRNNAQKLTIYLNKLKEKGKHIVGVGAPMKASTLLNYCKIGTDTLDYITELNPLKIGKYTPKTHIPIINEATTTFELPDYALILSWNFADSIISNWRILGYKGGFIVPVPEFHVINEVISVTDERGVITDILTDEMIEHVNHITFKKGAVRGNHYHKKSIHYDYVVKGTLEVYTCYPWEQVKKQIVNVGDLIFTGPNERHAVKALEDSEIIVLTRGPRGGKNYEIDTYHLPESEVLA